MITFFPPVTGHFLGDDTQQGLRMVYSADSNLSKRFSFGIAMRPNVYNPDRGSPCCCLLPHAEDAAPRVGSAAATNANCF